MKLILIQILCLFITLIAFKGSKQENVPFGILLSLLPGIGYLIALISLADILSRVKNSPSCFLGHNFELKDSSEESKHNARMQGVLIPASRCGFESYICTKCSKKETVKWDMF